MRFNFKKIASVLASIAMVGSTVGIAAAANYPSPFVANGAADVAVVIGANSLGSDSVGAADITSDLATQLASQTATGTASSGVSTSGGDSQDLATSSTKLYYNSTINAARTTLYKANLPTVLADGIVVDSEGTEYPYTQALSIGTNYITYSIGAGAYLTDPEIILNIPVTTSVTSASTGYLYQYQVSFTKAVNVTSSKIQSKGIKLQGTDWTIGASSTNVSLILYASGVDTSMNEGETKNVTIDGVDHTIQLVGVSSATEAVIIIDGQRTSVTEGSTYRVGSIEVYAKDLFYLSKTGSVSSGEFSVGSKKLTLSDGGTAKEGSDLTAIQGTLVNTTGKTTTEISGFTVSVGSKKATIDYLKAGGQLVDPVFEGIAINLASVTPALDSAGREKILVDTDNNANARVTFTSAKASAEATISYAHDQNALSTAVSLILADSANKSIIVREGGTVKVGQYVVVNYGDNGRILRLDEVSITNSAADYITFADAITGESFKVTTGADDHGALSIDGQTYYVGNASTDSAYIVWGAGTSDAAAMDAGTQTTLFPRIKLKNGAWLAFLAQTNVTNGTTYSLPGLEAISTYETGINLALATVAVNETAELQAPTAANGGKFGSVQYIIKTSGTTDAGVTNVSFSGTNIVGIGSIVTNCNFTTAQGPAILLLEEHRLGQTNGEAICIPLTTTGTLEVAVGTPVYTNKTDAALALTTLTSTSDTSKSKGLTVYGSLVERDTSTGTNNYVKVMYPEEEMTVNVLVTSAGTSISVGSSTGGNVVALGKVSVKDSDIASVQAKNLIVVGGSCINSVSANLLGFSSPTCGADFTAKAGVSSGQFLIGVYNSPYTTGKIAMLVAGYDAADTTSATAYAVDKKPDTTVGTMLKKTSVTYADVA